jgi:phage baseplate assembly protein W
MNQEHDVHDDHPGANELAGRLEAYASVRLSPKRAAARRVRAAVVEEARMRALETTIGSMPHRHARGPSRIVALLLAAALTLATAAAVSAASTPGGPLYGARIWLDTVSLPANADARALERIRQIEDRLLDAELAAASGDQNAIAAAIEAYRAAVASALDEVGTDADHLVRLEAALGLHVAVLEALVNHVPEAAADGINRALEASQNAVNAIDKATPGRGPQSPDPAADPTERPGPSNRPDHTPRGGSPTSP